MVHLFCSTLIFCRNKSIATWSRLVFLCMVKYNMCKVIYIYYGGMQLKKYLFKYLKWQCIMLNAAIGYCLPMYFTLLFLYFTNQPKGFSYYIPPEGYVLYLLIAMVMILILIFAELLINLPTLKLWEPNKKKMLLLIFAFTIFGVLVYFGFNSNEAILRAIKWKFNWLCSVKTIASFFSILQWMAILEDA